MNILVLNAGSSSLKYQVIKMPSQEVKSVGLIERIGLDDAIFTHEKGNQEYSEIAAIKTHKEGLQKIASILLDEKKGVLLSVDDIKAVGHRVVHGGNKFGKPTIVNQEVKDNIRNLFDLAPLHNPANLMGIEVAESIFPSAIQIAIFDTAFHQTMPKVAYQYAIPNEYLEQHKIRAYGFHGTSHKYVSEKAIAHLGKESSKKIITIHLGNGCSMSAIKNGESIENSLGLGPMNGLVMGTRCGDIDQSVIFFLMKNLKMTLEETNNLVQKESGMKGLTGFSDLREISEKAALGDQNCQNALALSGYRIRKYIGGYTAILNGLDAIVFTAGIGENSSLMRKLACENLDFLGIELNLEQNEIRSKEIREIQTKTSKVKVLVIPTNEEIEIAKQSYQLLK
ncbi:MULTISPECIES: acetate/propionate family kinase [unclassified Polaribacter]|uniref:acetate/propionate family kinase n=1 Tax=unclassified Polaribacter TaxID=196858 RepID=UPI0011BE3258|nr:MULTISPECIES: acetate kinase [unclassified Polaribacter]TXD51051.1 acetate kinase [Polaribacter sp. IC063]TXD57932.1 acetate kinase [Polaribacter sp. IC066]